jgi:hypothetical protein
VGDIARDWAIAWVLYSFGTALLAAGIVRALHSKQRSMPERVAIAVLLLLLLVFVWGGLVTILIDNCGAGGDCDPYKGVLGWPEGKAMFLAALPIFAGALVSEGSLRIRRRPTRRW